MKTFAFVARSRYRVAVGQHPCYSLARRQGIAAYLMSIRSTNAETQWRYLLIRMLKAKAATAICGALWERVQCKEGFLYSRKTADVAGTLAILYLLNEVRP